MTKFKARRAGQQIAKKLVYPHHLFNFFRLLLRNNRSAGRSDNAQLKLYSQVLSTGFLHYGYFEDPGIIPERISLLEIQQAQLRYAELLLTHIVDKESPVLDVGCGLGGLIGLLLQQEIRTFALTPDHSQIQHVRKKYLTVPLVEEKFENLPVNDYPHFFGTVIMSESLQYLKLERSLTTMERILKGDGRWIVSDYFRILEGFGKSGHPWEKFTSMLHEKGWQIVYQRDITQNVLPTLACAHMWGKKLGFPLLTFVEDKLQRKSPGVYYLVQEVLENLRDYLASQLDIIDPQSFTQSKKYMQIVIERS